MHSSSRKANRRNPAGDALNQGARVGTGSLRRQAQIRRQRPDLELMEVRGNVPTRLKKLDQGDYDALILAVAGLERLGLGERVSQRLRPPAMYPAVGQGALGIECRAGDEELIQLLQAISLPEVRAAVTAERALLATLEAGCHAPLGALSSVEGESLRLQAIVLNPEGTRHLEATSTGSLDEPETIGTQLAANLLADGAADLMTPASGS